MKKRVPVAIAAVLTACGAVVTTSNDSAESAPQKSSKAKQPVLNYPSYDRGGMAGCFDPKLSGYARVAAERIGGVPCKTNSAAPQNDNDPYAGRWRGSGELTITAAGSGRYKVYLETGAPGCGGEIKGWAVASSSRLMLSVTPPQPGYQACTVAFGRKGPSLEATEYGDCHLFYGGECSFGGDYSRLSSGGAAATQPTAPPSTSPSIVGVWVQQGDYCASGDAVVIDANGSYRNSGGDVDGRWSLSGNALTVLYSDIDPTTGESQGAPQRAVIRVTRVNANEIRLDQRRMRRCPPNGGAEPWHPGQTFTTR
jgi:hypothetical protein